MEEQEQIIRDLLFLLLTKSEEVCLSGGATGADSLWSRIWKKNRDKETVHYSFEGHNAYCTKAAGFRVILPENRLLSADNALKKAKKTNQRNFPCRSTKTNNLLRRNFYQVLHSDSMYAVSRIKHGLVDGGTNWAVQMFIDRHMEITPHAECPCYVYDMSTDKWYQWTTNTWSELDPSEVPEPKGIWTGIGSRELTESACNAMEALWHNTSIQQPVSVLE